MNARLAASVLGAAALGAIGWAVAKTVGGLAGDAPALALAGLVLGLILTPLLFAAPLRRLDEYVRHAPVEDLAVALFGLGVGLFISALLTFPLVLLGSPVGNLLPTIVALVVSLVCMRVALVRRADVRALFAARTSRPAGRLPDNGQGAFTGNTTGASVESGPLSPASNGHNSRVLLDTSIIIDGRIADISATGFINGEIIVPRFVLDELQHIADSPDPLRRTRGRRGLDMLNRMSKEIDAPITILDVDPREVRDVHEVDSKLVHVARKLHAPIITNDFNLNKIAQLQGVRVLNVNELANAVKPVVLPGEEMMVRIIQTGREVGQGVGYLDDGTMIVVEDGARHIDQEVAIVVTRGLQTAAGRMIFATLKGQNGRGPYIGPRGR